MTAALQTGCRYGEIAAMRVRDFDPSAGIVTVPKSKSGKARHVTLSEEGVAFFSAVSAGMRGDAPLLLRSSGAPWKQADQFRPMRNACAAARIEPAISFHILRHTHASRLAMKGTPMAVIAAQLGHADTRMTEKHYAHLAPSYVADTIRANFGAFGFASATNIVALHPAASRASMVVP